MTRRTVLRITLTHIEYAVANRLSLDAADLRRALVRVQKDCAQDLDRMKAGQNRFGVSSQKLAEVTAAQSALDSSLAIAQSVPFLQDHIAGLVSGDTDMHDTFRLQDQAHQ